MRPLEAARRLLVEPDWYWCGFCGVIRTRHTGLPPQPHESHCPWLARTRIFAALEAAERVVAAWQADNGHQRVGSGWAVDFDRGIAWAGEKREAEAALVAALKGDEVTA